MNLARSILLCALQMLLSAGSVWAVDPGKRLSQYAHTTWRLQGGFFSGAPHAIAQTVDGYLWIGTEAGLVRFDGVRFAPWTPPQETPLPSPNIYSLLATRDGSLWIGTGRGVARWSNGRLVTFPDIIGRINAFLEDAEGTVWMVRSRLGGTVKGALCRFDPDGYRCYGEPDGIACRNAGALVADRVGNLWFGGSNALCRWKAGESEAYLRHELERVEGLAGIHAIAVGRDGSLWVGIPRTGRGLGLQRLARGVWTSAAAPGLDGTSLEVSALHTDRDNAVWIGTMKQGIYRVHDGRVAHFGGADGLSSDTIDNFYQDSEGNLWVVTSKGVDRFRDVRVASFSVREGLTADRVNSVCAASDGTVWVGNQGALDAVRDGAPSSISSRNGLPGKNITSLFEDHAGRMWVGVDGGLTVYEGGRFRRVARRDGRSLGIVTAITEDTDDNIWVSHAGKPTGLFRIHDFEVREELLEPQIPSVSALARDRHSGIWFGLGDGGLARYRNGHLERFPIDVDRDGGAVQDLIVDADGSVWAATRRQGVVRWKDGTVKTLGVRNGLPCDRVFSLVKDDRGALWLYTACGLVTIADSELAKWWNDSTTAVRVRTLDMLDGVQPAPSTFRPQASKSPDGRLWFANDTVLQVVDPADSTNHGVPPPVHIEQVIADRRSYLPRDGLQLQPLTRDIEVDYTATSFTIPEKVQFRHKLEGYDREWQDPRNRRQAFYSNLAPGTYVFRVIAGNHDGVWNTRGATMRFVVPPAWFQTNGFRSLCVVAGALVAWGLYRLRLRQISVAMSARFDERLAERTRIARELHDTLLQTIQGSKMVADDALEQCGNPVRMQRAIEQLSNWLGEAVQEGRAALNSLRTAIPEEDDLIEAFRGATESSRVPPILHIAYFVVGEVRVTHPIVRDEIYRIGYEAIRNACAHSAASQLHVELRYGQDLTVRVTDNGVGIDRCVAEKGKDGHFGLQGMRERAAHIRARLTVVSTPGSGTAVTLVVPGGIAFRKASATLLGF